MRIRVSIVLAVAATLVGGSSTAAEAAPFAMVKLPSCRTGAGGKQGRATFYARMRAIPGSTRMAMRFTLLDRSSGGRVAVPVAELAQWHRSRSGVQAFGYSQTVTGLRAGGAYAVSVEFRWSDARGRTIKTVRRASADCRQRGALPNLVITGISAQRDGPSGKERYSVGVRNSGTGAATGVRMDLSVDGAAADAAKQASIAPGATVTLRVLGPACVHKVRAVVTRHRAIHETLKRDKVLDSRCPAVTA